MALLHHFSEDRSIDRFVPHVPKSNPSHKAAVWAIDAEHAPLYWFPRNCPRVTVWPLSDDFHVDISHEAVDVYEPPARKLRFAAEGGNTWPLSGNDQVDISHEAMDVYEPPARKLRFAAEGGSTWPVSDNVHVAGKQRPHDEQSLSAFRAAFGTTHRRVHIVELAWLDRIASVRLFRYDFDRAPFVRWVEARGQWIAESEVEPVAMTEMPCLFDLHAKAGIELRAVPDLSGYADLAVSDEWNFSLVRMSNAVMG